MIELKNIKKTYFTSGNNVHALKDIDLSFRKNEFVSILGASGCGKTTLLNIIGGLDKYTSGDMIVNGKSTKKFSDNDWDTYRNHTIGFVFQNYNLIPHQTVLENVSLSLKLNGNTSSKQIKQIAKKALIKVGLGDKLNYKPNQLSGGQCQRVAIARALVNDPDIILADEPTGALDSKTSVQVMKILKEISKDKLVIMVTHNPELANKYSNRIINIKDGIIEGDSNPYDNHLLEKQKKSRKRKSYMPFKVSFMLSLKNLLSKKKRTFITCLAGSIGIIGIATILSVSSGMSNYVKKIESESTAYNYIIIQDSYTDIENMMMIDVDENLEEYSNKNNIYMYNDELTNSMINQNINDEYITYLEDKIKDKVVDIKYTYDVDMNLIAKKDDTYNVISNINFTEMLNNQKYLNNDYEVLASIKEDDKIPTKYNELVLVVDKYNRVPSSILTMLGIDKDKDLKYEDFLGKEIKLIDNNNYYINKNGLYIKASTNNELEDAYNSGESLKIVSILRLKEDASNEWIRPGIGYTKELTDYVLNNSMNSDVVNAQKNSKDIDVTTGLAFNNNVMNNPMFNISATYEDRLKSLGADKIPTTISIYPNNYDSKNEIINLLDDWNNNHENNQIKYIDISSIMITLLDSMINIVSYVLIAFSSISLVVSSIMISIVIYNSVIERTKEIGILRAMGARKKDVSRVFKAEAVIIGLASGIVAIVITFIICSIINNILGNLINVTTIANLTLKITINMILLSVILTFIASLIPARMAAKKDPVVALRTE